MILPIIFVVSATASADPVKFVNNGSPPYPDAKTSMTTETCTKVDLSKKMGPVRSQTGGTCYAYAAMELMNFNQPETYSALHLALLQEGEINDPGNENSLDTVKGFNGGHIDEAIKLGMQTGLCPNKIAPSVSAKDEVYVGLLDYYKNAREGGYMLDGECISHFLKTILDEKVETIKDIQQLQMWKLELWRGSDIKKYIRKIYPKLNPNKLDEIFWMSTSATDFTKKLALLACKDHLKKPVPPGKGPANVKTINPYKMENGKEVVYDRDRKAMLDQINSTLTGGKPVGISYYTQNLILTGPSMHGAHASTVAGRTWVEEARDKSGKVVTEAGCYYVIKNSWGSDWKPARGTKAKRVKGKPGFFMVSEKDLLEHTYGATYID